MATNKRKKKSLPKELIEAAARGSVPHGNLAKAKVHTADGLDAHGISGMTGYDRKTGKVTEIFLPLDDDAYGQTVRGHEGRHATLPHEKHEYVDYNDPVDGIVSQIADDAIIEQIDLPRIASRSYRRVHLATAMRDLRKNLNELRDHKLACVQLGLSADEPPPWNIYNGILCSCVRSAAILQNYEDFEGNGDYDKTTKRRDILNSLIGDDYMQNVVDQILWEAKQGKHEESFKLLRSIMEEPPRKAGESKPKGKDKKPDGKVHKHPAKDGQGEPEMGYMTIVELLPRSSFAVRTKQVDMIYTTSGSIINSRRLVNAKISKTANGLFSRRVQQKAGGTVLIDASGSMGITQERLAQLCQSIPTATIAYYNGTSGDNKGTLHVYARNGKRFTPAKGKKLPMAGGNNTVDLPAIKWLMRQEEPWTFVTDLQFCGGPSGHAMAALALATRMQKTKRILFIPMIHEALKHFEKQAKEVK